MKLVATTRLKKAEEMFALNKPSLLRLDDYIMEMKGDAADGEEAATPTGGSKLVMCLSTERGLCGSVNSSCTKIVKNMAIENKTKKDDISYVMLGNKSAQALGRLCADNIRWSAKDIGGKQGPKFADVLPVAEKFSKENFDEGILVKNKFVNLLVFETQEMPMMSREQMQDLEAYAYEYDSGVREEFACIHLEFNSYCIPLQMPRCAPQLSAGAAAASASAGSAASSSAFAAAAPPSGAADALCERPSRRPSGSRSSKGLAFALRLAISMFRVMAVARAAALRDSRRQMIFVSVMFVWNIAR